MPSAVRDPRLAHVFERLRYCWAREIFFLELSRNWRIATIWTSAFIACVVFPAAIAGASILLDFNAVLESFLGAVVAGAVAYASTSFFFHKQSEVKSLADDFIDLRFMGEAIVEDAEKYGFSAAIADRFNRLKGRLQEMDKRGSLPAQAELAAVYAANAEAKISQKFDRSAYLTLAVSND